MNGAKYEVVLGKSGRWIARKVAEEFANGRVRVEGPTFTGHVPVRRTGFEKAREIIQRQLRRKLAAGETSQPGTGPRGGTSFLLTL